MRIGRELIIDVDVLRSSFDVRPHCEDALLWLPRLVEELWNELPAVGEGSCHGQEVVVADGALLQVEGSEFPSLFELSAEKAHIRMRSLTSLCHDLQIPRPLELFEPT